MYYYDIMIYKLYHHVDDVNVAGTENANEGDGFGERVCDCASAEESRRTLPSGRRAFVSK